MLETQENIEFPTCYRNKIIKNILSILGFDFSDYKLELFETMIHSNNISSWINSSNFNIK